MQMVGDGDLGEKVTMPDERVIQQSKEPHVRRLCSCQPCTTEEAWADKDIAAWRERSQPDAQPEYSDLQGVNVAATRLSIPGRSSVGVWRCWHRRYCHRSRR